jgi:hypothetical protein
MNFTQLFLVPIMCKVLDLLEIFNMSKEKEKQFENRQKIQ